MISFLYFINTALFSWKLQSHIFCFECIEAWSKTENTCPLCKKRFSSIEQLSDPTDESSQDNNVNSNNKNSTTSGKGKGKGRGAKKSKEKVKKVKVKKRNQADSNRRAHVHPLDLLLNMPGLPLPSRRSPGNILTQIFRLHRQSHSESHQRI